MYDLSGCPMYFNELADLSVYVANLDEDFQGDGGWLSLPRDQKVIDSFLEHKVGEEYEVTEVTSDTYHISIFSEDLDDYLELADRLENMDSREEELVDAVIDYFGGDINEIIDDIDGYILYDDINNDYDLGYYWAVESGCYNIDGDSVEGRYFDYEAFGRDIAMEADGGFCALGFIERQR